MTFVLKVAAHLPDVARSHHNELCCHYQTDCQQEERYLAANLHATQCPWGFTGTLKERPDHTERVSLKDSKEMKQASQAVSSGGVLPPVPLPTTAEAPPHICTVHLQLHPQEAEAVWFS